MVMKEWLAKQNTTAMASVFIGLVTWLLAYLAGERALRFLSLLFLGQGVVILFLDWLKGSNGESEVGEILILDREDGRRTAQEVAFSSMLVYDSLVDIMELKGVATRREVETRMEEVKNRYRQESDRSLEADD